MCRSLGMVGLVVKLVVALLVAIGSMAAIKLNIKKNNNEYIFLKYTDPPSIFV